MSISERPLCPLVPSNSVNQIIINNRWVGTMEIYDDPDDMWGLFVR